MCVFCPHYFIWNQTITLIYRVNILSLTGSSFPVVFPALSTWDHFRRKCWGLKLGPFAFRTQGLSLTHILSPLPKSPVWLCLLKQLVSLRCARVLPHVTWLTVMRSDRGTFPQLCLASCLPNVKRSFHYRSKMWWIRNIFSHKVVLFFWQRLCMFNCAVQAGEGLIIATSPGIAEAVSVEFIWRGMWT